MHVPLPSNGPTCGGLLILHVFANYPLMNMRIAISWFRASE